jgi:hypothetical protein
LCVTRAGEDGGLQNDGEQQPQDLDATAVHELHHRTLDGRANKKLSEKRQSRQAQPSAALGTDITNSIPRMVFLAI